MELKIQPEVLQLPLAHYEKQTKNNDYVIAVSPNLDVPYVLTHVKRGSSISYVFVQIGGKQFRFDSKNRIKTIQAALESKFRVYSYDNKIEFLNVLKTLIQRYIAKQIENEI